MYPMVRARLDKSPKDVAAMFDQVAKRYDVLNDSAFASDFSLGMLEAGARRERELPFIAADNLALPFADNAFDVVTISFGLRNVANTKSALEEAHRVCAPGGRLVVCEFSHPTNRLFRTIYFRYLMRVLPPLARAFSSNPDAYTYLAESIEAWPNQSALAEIISQAGWSSVAWQNRTGGIVAIHSAFKAFKG